jgi:hypothetical protein
MLDEYLHWCKSGRMRPIKAESWSHGCHQGREIINGRDQIVMACPGSVHLNRNLTLGQWHRLEKRRAMQRHVAFRAGRYKLKSCGRGIPMVPLSTPQ